METQLKAKSVSGLKRLNGALGYSLQGLQSAYRHEQAFRQEVWASLILGPIALWLGRTALETLVLLGSLALVLIVELLNSSIEATVDRISMEHHELSKIAKDQGSAAVFLSLLLCAGIWLTLIFQRLITSG